MQVDVFDVKKRDRYAKILIWACFAFYTLMLASKNVYTAEIVSLMSVFKTTKAQTSLAMTYYFVVYAIVQIILSFTMTKVNLRFYLTITGIMSALLTIMMGFAPNITTLYILCAVNGIMQAGIYSGCMSVLAKYLPNYMLPSANRIMSMGAAFYAVLAYGVPSLFVGFGLWNVPFILLGVIFFISTIVFFLMVGKMKKFSTVDTPKITKTTVVENEKPIIQIKGKKGVAIYFTIMLTLTLFSMTGHYSVLNWIPNMLTDVYSMPESFSILITLVGPAVSLAGSLACINLCQKYKNLFYVGGTFMIIGTICFIPMIFAFDCNIILAVVLIIIYLTMSAGARAILSGIIAFKMRARIDSGSYLAAYNGVASVIAGVIPPLIGLLIDAFPGVQGYGVSYLFTTVFNVLFILGVFAYGYWFKKRKRS